MLKKESLYIQNMKFRQNTHSHQNSNTLTAID